RLVHQAPVWVAEGRAADLDPTVALAVVDRLRDHVSGLERRLAGRLGVVQVGDVVGHRVEPLAVDGHAGAGDPDRAEELGHQAPLMTVRRRPNLSSTARSIVW